MEWWRTAVFYEVYVSSFADSTGSGTGDLRGVTQHLDHLVELGVDALWLTPFYRSPMADHGYDVADPRDVDPRFGDLAAFDDLVSAAHGHGLRVVVDVVPNHVSDQHEWFQQALADPAARRRFHFRDRPNNWVSEFGGPAWTQVEDGQHYLHLFAPGQPDLDWDDPDVGDDLERTLRFWLDRGVDGFRIDVAHGLAKSEGLPDDPGGGEPDLLADPAPDMPMWDREGVHDVWRRWHRVAASYDHDPVLVGEVWLGDAERQARYVRPDELHLAFGFRLLFSAWEASELRDAITRSTEALRAVGAPASWVLSNHDVTRHVTRYGGGELGLRRARAALLLVLGLPGAVFLYQGEELGLEEVDLPDEALQDPVWERSGHTRRGRDGCRVPLPWSGSAPPYGFSSGPRTWLPQPEGWGAVTVETERDDQGSVLALYRRALAVRPRDPGRQPLVWHRGPADTAGGVLDLSTSALRVVVNLSRAPVALPGGELLLTSGPLEDGLLPVDTAAWLAAQDEAISQT